MADSHDATIHGLDKSWLADPWMVALSERSLRVLRVTAAQKTLKKAKTSATENTVQLYIRFRTL